MYTPASLIFLPCPTGLVSVYDSDKFNEALQPSLPYKGKLVHPPYAPTKTEFASSRQRVCREFMNIIAQGW